MIHEEAEKALAALEQKADNALARRAWVRVQCCDLWTCRLTASISYGYTEFQYFHHGYNIDRKGAIAVLMLEDRGQ